MTTALQTTERHPADAPTAGTPTADTLTPRRRRDRDAAAGISASELLARYAEAGFDAPASGGRRAARTAREGGALGPALERIDTPAELPAPGTAAGPDTAGPHTAAGDGDTVVTHDLPAGVTARSAIGLVRGPSDTGPLGTRPRAVAATMSATLVGATAVLGVVSSLGSPDEAADEQSSGVDLAGVDNQATMKLSVPAAGADRAGGTGTSQAASTVHSGLQHVTAAVPQAFEQADAARIAAVAKREAEQRAADARERAAEARSSAASSSGDGAGTGTVAGDPVTDLSGSANGLQALAAAKSKLGAPYQWGATGPSAFDCSGLMVWAFEKVGVDLPRTSKAQSQMDGQDVSKDELKPGDMVFFYSPVSHVGIYAGNGKVLHASTSGEPVKYSDLDDMPFHNAVRV